MTYRWKSTGLQTLAETAKKMYIIPADFNDFTLTHLIISYQDIPR